MNKWTLIIIALLTFALVGCQENNSGTIDPTLNNFFLEDAGEPGKPSQFADIQAASGARFDATLSKAHFDGAKLNSLGEAKLALMLKDDDAPTPVSVHLNMGEKDTLSKQRKESVLVFMKDQGLKETQVEVVYGDNPATRTPTAASLANLKKTDTGVAGAAGEAAAAGTATGGWASPSDAGLLGSSGAK